MITTILFDFGGVLGTDVGLVKILVKHGMDKEKAIKFWRHHWSNLKKGVYGTKEVWKVIKQELNSNSIKKEYERTIQVYPEMISLCNKLKSYKLGILANETKEWMNIKRKKGNLNKLFDKIYSSAEIKSAKPDKKAFNYILKALKSKPKETIFIDNQENNIQAAKKLGMKTILFKNSKQLKKELKSLIGNF